MATKNALTVLTARVHARMPAKLSKQILIPRRLNIDLKKKLIN